MKISALLLFVAVAISGCAATPPPRAIYAVAKQDMYAGENASRDFFYINETPCVKISGYGSSTFSYKLYKQGILESFDTGTMNKLTNNEILTCWKNLPVGSYTFQIFDSTGSYVSALVFSIGQ